MSNKALNAAIISYISGLTESGASPSKVDAAVDLLYSLFDLNASSVAELTSNGPSLQSIFPTEQSASADPVASSPEFLKFLESITAKGFFAGTEEGTSEYQSRFEKALLTFKKRAPKDAASAPTSTSTSPSVARVEPSSEDLAAAEDAKARGNKFLQMNKFADAIKCYSEAIEKNPTGSTSHIYFANRSAAYTSSSKFSLAIADAERAIELDKTYSKAYNRLAMALEREGMIQQAIEAYERCLDVDPSYDVARSELARLRSIASTNSNVTPAASSAPASGGGGGMPDFSSMLNGMGGLEGLMKNPMVAQMAQNLMKDPNALNDLMKNPALANMMGGLGGMGKK